MTIIERMAENKNNIIVCLLLCLFCLRTIHLDLDSPTYALLQYTRVDEGHYAMQALRTIMRDEMELVEQADGGLYETWNSSASFLNTVFCTLTLSLFGKTYYGLRMAPFMAGFLSFALILWMIAGEEKLLYMRQFPEKRRPFGWVLLVTGGGMLLNFPYLIACRFNDPGIFRILTIVCTLFFVWKSCGKPGRQKATEQEGRKDGSGRPGYFWLGFLSILCVVWGYATNIFVFVPAGVLLLMEVKEGILARPKGEKDKSALKKTGKMAAGVLAGYLGGEAVIYLAQGTTFMATFFRINRTMGETRVSFRLGGLVNNILQLSMGNIFSYNAVFMALSIISVLYVLVSGHRKKDRFRIYLAWLSVGFAAQSMFTNDALIRKSIVIYPVLVLTVALFLMDLINGQEQFGRILKRKKGIVSLVIVVMGGMWFYIAVRRLGLIEEIDLPGMHKKVLIGLNAAAFCLCMSAMLLITVCKGRKRGAACILVLAAMIMPDLFLTGHYYRTADYEDKEIMEEMQSLIGNNFVLGGYPYGYCFYNDIIPASSTYDKFLPEEREERAKVLLGSDRKVFFLGNDEKELIDGWLVNGEDEWVLVKVFEETMRDYGGRTRLYLYERKKGG